jgi:hypothetical protein
MTNAHLEQVYEKYWNAFETFRKIPMIRTLEDNEHFCQTLKRLLDDHLTIIPSLTIGIVESSPHLPPEQLDGFMERMLRSRISRRVLAEQHIALSEALDDPFHFFNEESSSAHEAATHNSDGDHIGIIYTSLKVSSIIEKVVRLLTKIFEDEIKAGTRTGDAAIIPEVIIDGALETRFAYIPEHLEYIFFELLKNSMMAVMRQPLTARDPVTIRATIVEGPPDEDLIVRVSDCGGGLPDLVSKIHSHNLRRETHRRKQSRLAARRRRDSHDEDANRTSLTREQPNADAQITMDSTLSDDPSGSFAAALHSMEHARDIALSGPIKHATADLAKTAAAASATAATRGAAAIDPLVATVTSFSNVRRRLEIEDEAMRRAQQAKDTHAGDRHDVDSSTAGAESPGREKEALSQGFRAFELGAADARGSGLDSRAKLDVLRSVGRFKGTVAEQLASHDAQQRSGDAAIPWDEMGIAASAAVSGDLRGSFSRQETGLGLPMTKIYTDFFGGCLSLRSLDGHGMDVYVRLPKLGTNKEAIEEIVL